ncbi:MAG: hypothetical protein ACLUNZ_03910 [Evtepia sp.]
MKHPRIVFPLALAAAILLGSFLGAHHSTRAEQTRREAVAQQHIDAAQFCQQLAEAIVQGEQDSLLAQYYGLDGMPEDTRAQLKERLSLLDMLPLGYQGCEEAGGEREISETEFWKDFCPALSGDGRPAPGCQGESACLFGLRDRSVWEHGPHPDPLQDGREQLDLPVGFREHGSLLDLKHNKTTTQPRHSEKEVIL